MLLVWLIGFKYFYLRGKLSERDSFFSPRPSSPLSSFLHMEYQHLLRLSLSPSPSQAFPPVPFLSPPWQYQRSRPFRGRPKPSIPSHLARKSESQNCQTPSPDVHKLAFYVLNCTGNFEKLVMNATVLTEICWIYLEEVLAITFKPLKLLSEQEAVQVCLNRFIDVLGLICSTGSPSKSSVRNTFSPNQRESPNSPIGIFISKPDCKLTSDMSLT